MNDELSELLALVPDREEEALAQPRFRTAELCERLLTHIDRTRIEDPILALPLARFALRLAAKLPDATVGRTWATWASVQRALCRYDLAESGYRVARLFLHEPIDLARFHRRQAYLLRDRGQFTAAKASLGRALTIYLATGDTHSRGCTLTDLATIHFAEGDHGEAVLRNCEALRYLDPTRDPEYHTCAVHNLAAALAEIDFPGARLEVLLKETRQERYRPGTLPWAKHRWLEGLIFKRRGRHRRAESTLKAARNQLLKLGAVYDAGLVTLDLAEIYQGLGEWELSASLAKETIAVLQTLGTVPSVKEGNSTFETLRQKLAELSRATAGRS